MSNIKLTMERAVIEDNQNGYCSIARIEENGDTWLEIHGNMDAEVAKDDYPLCLSSEFEIDEFAKHLKKILAAS